MGVLVSLTDTIGRAMEVLAEKGRRAAKVSRLQSVIRSEERAANEAYLSLGRYYYRHLRDQGGEEQQKLCLRIDKAMERVDRAVEKLEEAAMEAEDQKEQDPCMGCRQMSCAACACYEDEDSGAEEAGEDVVPVPAQPDEEEKEPETENGQPEETEEAEEAEEPAIVWPVTGEKTKESSCGSIPQPEVPQPARETPEARIIDRSVGREKEKDREVADIDDVLQIPFL